LHDVDPATGAFNWEHEQMLPIPLDAFELNLVATTIKPPYGFDVDDHRNSA